MGPLSSRRRRALWLARAAWVLGGTTLLLVLGEAVLRFSCLRSLSDIRRSQHVWARLWNLDNARVLDGKLRLMIATIAWRPDIEKTLPVCGEMVRFTTRAAPNPAIGYRSNGPEADSSRPFGVVLGGSKAEGAQVSDSQTYASVLSRATSRRFVNLAAFGQGVIAHRKRLQASGFLRRRPRVLILHLSPNDLVEDRWMDMTARLKVREKPMYFHRYGHGVVAAALAPWREPLRRLEARSVLLFLAANTLRTSTRQPHPLMDALWTPLALRIHERELAEFHRLARAHGAKLLVLQENRDLRELGLRGPQGPDVAWAMARIPRSQTVRFDGHWDADGHAEAARLLRSVLAEKDWLEGGQSSMSRR